MEGTKRRKKAHKAKKCLTCPSKAVIRGICRTCFTDLRVEIRAERATDEELVAKGLILPKRNTGRPRRRK